MTSLKTTNKNSFLDLKLFVGVALDTSLKKNLSTANPHLVKLFTQGNDYLIRAREGDLEYLGKYVDFPLTISELELVEKNVKSLVLRLTPGHVFEKNQFVIFSPSQ